MIQTNLDDFVEKVEALTDTRPVQYSGIGGDQTFEIPAAHLAVITRTINEVFDCSHLSAITAQQRGDQAQEIEVLYHFWHGVGFSFLIRLPAGSPELPSISKIIPGADFYEREAAEMFGIRFSGREETPPLLLPDDWVAGPPFIRKEAQDD